MAIAEACPFAGRATRGKRIRQAELVQDGKTVRGYLQAAANASDVGIGLENPRREAGLGQKQSQCA
ncbi:hypothetical protein ABTE32_22225, partial [Acinetobacter baumannii]